VYPRLSAWQSGVHVSLVFFDAVLWDDVLRRVKIGGMVELATPAQPKQTNVKAISSVTTMFIQIKWVLLLFSSYCL
jgi:hypothetical protein